MKTAREIELEKELKLFKIAYLLIINDLLPDMNCDNCRYKNKDCAEEDCHKAICDNCKYKSEEFCKDKDCHKAIYHYFLNKAKE